MISPENCPYTESELEEAVEEILELYQAGQLYTDDIYENYIRAFKDRQTVVRLFHPSPAPPFGDCLLRKEGG